MNPSHPDEASGLDSSRLLERALDMDLEALRRHDPFAEWRVSTDVARSLATRAGPPSEVRVRSGQLVRLMRRRVVVDPDLPPNSMTLG